MTLCIAAVALQNHPFTMQRPKWAAILSYDQRIESEVAASERTFKYRVLSPNWRAMFAGDVSNCNELLGRFSLYLKPKESEITMENVLGELWTPILEHREQVERRGIERKAQDELLLVGLIEQSFRIFRFDWQGLTEQSPFGAIGRGSYVAEAILHGRHQSTIFQVPEMLYRVYEAQRIGAIVPTVGMNAKIHLLTQEDGSVRDFVLNCNDYLEELWGEFGFRPIRSNLDESKFERYEIT